MDPTPLTVTPDQVEQFRRDGFLPLGRILDDDERSALLHEEARFRPDRSYGADGASTALYVRDQLCHHSSVVRRFCTQGRHLGVLPALLGPDVAFTHTQFITKLPSDESTTPDGGGTSRIPMHQDDGYGTLEPALDVTIWTALTETNEDNGCLVIVPGSHTRGILDHDVAAANPSLREAPLGDRPAVALALGAGEAVAFTGLTLHGSGPNRTDEPRVGMHARYCVPWARMVTEGDRPVLEDLHSWMVFGEAPLDGWRSANDKFGNDAAASTP